MKTLRFKALCAVLLAWSALLLAGCGFQLAGSRPLPPPLQSAYIDFVAPYRVSEPPLEVSLRTLLQRRGGHVTGSPSEAKAVIRLSNLKESRVVLSIGTDGKVLEFQLVTSVTYQVNAGDKVLMPPDTLTLSRSYSFKAEQVLAEDAEEAHLREYIQNELAELLLLRMEAVLGHAADAPVDAAVPAVTMPAAAPAGSPDAAPPP